MTFLKYLPKANWPHGSGEWLKTTKTLLVFSSRIFFFLANNMIDSEFGTCMLTVCSY